MKSSEDSESGEFNLERDLPTSAEDVEALRRASRASQVMDTSDYFDWILTLPHQPDLRKRRVNSVDDPPFEAAVTSTLHSSLFTR